jgi:hypothetical protein
MKAVEIDDREQRDIRVSEHGPLIKSVPLPWAGARASLDFDVLYDDSYRIGSNGCLTSRTFWRRTALYEKRDLCSHQSIGSDPGALDCLDLITNTLA